MSDTSNQIIQTLEAIHNDIKAAKDTLKSNNVALDSNATSTLSAEINKIPTAIKESDTLIGFNNGKMSISGSIVYSEKSNYIDRDNSLFLAATGPDFSYNLPDKEFRFDIMDIPTPNATYEETNAAMISGLNAPNITFNLSKMIGGYHHLLKSFYSDGINRAFVGKKRQSFNSLFVVKMPSNITPDSDGYYQFDDLYLPPSEFTLKTQDNTVIEKIKTNKFNFSYCKNVKEVKCDVLNVNPDMMFTFINELNNISLYPSFKFIVYNPSTTFTFDPLHNNYGINGKYYNSSKNDTVAQFSSNNRINEKIEIRVDDTQPDVLGKLHTANVMMNILQFVDIANMDGTKKYSFKQNKFVDASSFYTSNEVDYGFLGSYVIFMKSNRVILGGEVEDKDNFTSKYDAIEEPTNSLDNLLENTGYYYINNNSGVSDIKFSSAQISEYSINPFIFYSKIFGKEFTKIFNREITLDISSSTSPLEDNLPLLNISPVYMGMGSSVNYVQSYDFKGLNIKYDINIASSNIGLLLASPYSTKFINKNTSDNIDDIETTNTALYYNKNVKTVTLSNNGFGSKLYIPLSYKNPAYMDTKLEPYGYTMIEEPTTPIKFKLAATTKLINLDNTNNYPTGILGPYTTDAFAKKYDKFIHVLVPEDYPGLGTFDFEMYRLPLYNLDESKKYNYSKKAWEPVTALTDDSLSLSSIYPAEYSNYTSTNIFGFELKTENN